MPKLIPANSDFNKILQWSLNPDSNSLDVKSKEIFNRWDYCDNLLRKYSSQREVENLMKVKFPNISLVQIKRDIENTRRLFNSITTINKGYEKLFLIEDIKQTMLAAKIKGDLNARTKAQKNLYFVLGLDKEDSIDLSKLEKHEYNIYVVASHLKEKIDLTELHNISPAKRKYISDNINAEISDAEVLQILNPEIPYADEETLT